MSRTDPRLEAATGALLSMWQKNGEAGTDRAAALHIVRDTVTIVDALRAFDQAELHTVTSVTGYPIEDTSWLSQGVELNSEMLASIAISLKKLADYCGKPQPESEMERSHPCKGAGDCVGHPHDCYDHPHNCGCAKAATREEVMPHKPGPVHHEGPDNATAPVMGADPLWFEDCRQSVFGNADARFRGMQYQTMRALFAFANAQPPSDEAIRMGEGAFLEVWPSHLALPPEWRECVRAALVKARGGA